MSPGSGDDAKSAEHAELRAEVVDRALTVAKRVAKEGEGALFVVARPARVLPQLALHYPQLKYDGSVLDEGMDAVLAKLATLDGAVVVGPEGQLLAYGARIRRQRTLAGFGTRHAAARGYAEFDADATVILASEESGWVKVFQKGDCIVQIDPADVSAGTMRKVSRYLVNKDAAILTAAGISAATLGGAVPLLIIGGSYLVVRGAFETLSGMLKGEEREKRKRR